jgi:hypothetical protein
VQSLQHSCLQDVHLKSKLLLPDLAWVPLVLQQFTATLTIIISHIITMVADIIMADIIMEGIITIVDTDIETDIIIMEDTDTITGIGIEHR